MTHLDFSNARHTFVVSDIHLADAQTPDSKKPLWKRYKLPEHFVDHEFSDLLKFIQRQSDAPIELVLNGDIFDFDSVMTLPDRPLDDPSMKWSWIERLRGLNSEEAKSRFKFKIILDTHPVWMRAVRDFVASGNRVIFVIGNHDLELHWPSVQKDFVDRLALPPEAQGLIRFCEWFYISNQDTLIEHGNQYDAYCLCSNPVHPLVKVGTKPQIRMPFGNIAGKLMVNGMGLINPHANESFIKRSVFDYAAFYFKYVIKTEPLLIWTYFWSASLTLVYSLMEGFLPAMRDPLTIDQRLQEISEKANATIPMVIALKEVHVHPAIFNPIKIMRELWLDRTLLLVMIFFVSLQFFSLLNIFSKVSTFWFIFPFFFLIPAFVVYARNVESEVEEAQRAAFRLAPLSARITRVSRIIQGHTHREEHRKNEGVEVINTGTWSPAYFDVECTQPYGRKCFAWIQPRQEAPREELSDGPQTTLREAGLYEWIQRSAVRIPEIDTE